MTNQEYCDQIQANLMELDSLIAQSKEIARGVIGESLLKIDLCFCSLLDRCVRLSQGFTAMIQTRNITCAGALLRLQMDNCMRLFAVYIAENEDDVADCVITGEKISKLKDKDGQKMSDTYLKERLKQYDEHFPHVYEQASGFIHFSSKAFYSIVQLPGDNAINFQVGGELPEKINEPLIECLAAYIRYVNLFYQLMNAAVDAKIRFDQKQQGQEA